MMGVDLKALAIFIRAYSLFATLGGAQTSKKKNPQSYNWENGRDYGQIGRSG